MFRRLASRAWLAALLVSSVTAHAQDVDAGRALYDEETGVRYREVRPPEGMQRGTWPVAPWVVFGLSGVVVTGALVALVLRARKPSRRKV